MYPKDFTNYKFHASDMAGLVDTFIKNHYSDPLTAKQRKAYNDLVEKGSKSKTLAELQAKIDKKESQKHLAEAGLGYTQEATTEGLKTTLFDVDGNTKEFMYPAVFQGKPQDIGSAMTYAKRYALTACLGLIIEGEDDDGNTAQKSPKQEYKKFDETNTVWMTEDQKSKLVDLINSGENLKGVKATIAKYSGTIVDGVKYSMKKAYKEELNNLIKEFETPTYDEHYNELKNN